MNKKILTVIALTGIIAISNLTTTVYANPMVPMTEEERIQYLDEDFMTQEQIEIDARKYQEAIKFKKLARTPVVSNVVGKYKQETNYQCGPYAAKNALETHSSPSISSLSTSLGTTQANGTDFNKTRWQDTMNAYAPGNDYVAISTNYILSSHMETKIQYTIGGGYNSVVNLNHGPTSYPVHPQYANGIAHYIAVYGYNDYVDGYYVSDSFGPYRTYTAPYYNTWHSSIGMVY